MDNIIIKITADAQGFENLNKQLDEIRAKNKQLEDQLAKGHDNTKKRHNEHIDLNTKLSRSIADLGEGIAAAFAVEKVIEFGAECIKAFQEADRAARDLEFTVKNLAGGSSEALDGIKENVEDLSKSLKNLFTHKELEIASSALLKMNLTIDQTNKILPLLADVAAKANKPLQEIVVAVGKGISEGRMSQELTQLGIKFGNTGDMANRFNSAINGMQKYAGAASGALNELSNRSKITANNLEEDQEKVGSAIAGMWQATKEFFSPGLAGLVDKKQWKDAFIGSEALKKQLKDEQLQKDKRDEQKRINELAEFEQKEIEEATGKGGETKGFDYLKKLTEKELNVRKENAENNLKSEILEQDKLIGVKKQYGQLDLNREVHEIDKVLEDRKKANENLLKLYEKYYSDLENIRKKDADDLDKFNIELIKDETKKKLAQQDSAFRKEQEEFKLREDKLTEIIKKGKEDQRIKAKIELEALFKDEMLSSKANDVLKFRIQKDADEKLHKEQEEFNRKQLDDRLEWDKKKVEYEEHTNEIELKKKLLNGKVSQEKYDYEIKKLQLKALKDELELEQNAGLEGLDIQQKIKDKELELQKGSGAKLQGLAQASAEAGIKIFEGMAEEISSNINVIDSQMERQAKLVDVQKALAIAGRDNDLAFEAKKADDLEKQKIEQQKKLKKIKELEVFLNSVATYTESGNNPMQAISKALAVLAATKAAEAVYAEEGAVIGKHSQISTIGLNGFSRRHKSGKDVLVHAEENERILSVDQNKRFEMLGGLDMLKNPFEHKLTVVQPRFTQNNTELLQAVHSLEQTVKNKKETYYDFEGMDLRIIEIENGLKKVIRNYRN